MKRILFVAAAVHRRDGVERYCSYLQNLRCGLNRGVDKDRKNFFSFLNV